MKVRLISAAAMVLAAAGSASAASFTNGGFESPGGEVRDQLTANYLPGWTYSANGAYDIYEADDQGDGLPAADGTHYVSFGHNGTSGGSISQTFSTVVGQNYVIAYSVAEQQGDDPTQVLRLTVDSGVSEFEQDNTALTLAFAPGNSISFTALANTATITFLDATPAGDGGGSNLALDAVTVNGDSGVSAVPEPASWALMIGGFAAVGALTRRRRTLVTV